MEIARSKSKDGRYEELFKFELYSLNPTAWISTKNGWVRMMGY